MQSHVQAIVIGGDVVGTAAVCIISADTPERMDYLKSTNAAMNCPIICCSLTSKITGLVPWE